MIYILLAILFAFTKSERDLIGSSKFKKTLIKALNKKGLTSKTRIWWNTKDYTGASWWIENIVSFLGNGWHLMDFINVSIPYFAFGYLLGSFWYGLIFLMAGGGFHSYRNGSLLRKGSK